MPQPKSDAAETDAVEPVTGGIPHIRPAAIGDVASIHSLLDGYARMGNLLPRSFGELYLHLRDFFVLEIDGKIIACAALEIFTEDLGEVRSLVVAEEYMRRGFGKKLVGHIRDEARRIGLRRLMALTYVPDFFLKLGFQPVAKETLPEKVWRICVKCYKYDKCDETAVLLELK